jgi:hypothetical protein
VCWCVDCVDDCVGVVLGNWRWCVNLLMTVLMSTVDFIDYVDVWWLCFDLTRW